MTHKLLAKLPIPALALLCCLYSCDETALNPEIIICPVDTTVIPPKRDTTDVPVEYTATLTFDEAKEFVAGYNSPKEYTNSFGTWIICAYKNGSNMQLNKNKVAYIGTPEFEYPIRKLTLDFDEAYSGDIYLCSRPGSKYYEGLLLTASLSPADKSFQIAIPDSVSVNRLYVRAGACVRLTSLTVVYSGSGVTPDPDPDPTPDPDPDPDPNPTPTPTPDPGTTIASWYELPVVYDEDRNGVDDYNSNLYYASHSFSMSGKTMRNYTVCFSAEKHCPVWVAAPRHAVYSAKNASRSNAYRQDPDIPSNIQYSSKATGGGCNKGHMLGSSERLCSSDANRQVFYYSNIAPQLSSGFNTGGGGWNTLEDWVDNQVCADTLYEVVGCYFERYTDGYGHTVAPKTISFGNRNDVGFPTMFYYILLRTKSGSTGKALKDCSASELKCAAFVRAHTNSLKGQKVTSAEMMSVSDLEKVTGFTYFANVPQAPKDSFKASDWGL